MRLLNISFIFLCVSILQSDIYAQNHSSDDVAVAFYNCENFFDTIDDPAKHDDEFTPAGKYHYTERIYQQKLHHIATVLQHMNDDKGPAIIGLAEIENDVVLAALVQMPEISKRKYRYVWYSGPDPRGINVAMVYDPARFRVLHSEAVPVDISGTNGKSVTRDMLYVHGVLAGDTVDVMVNHWPSRRGGTDESSTKRDIAARANRAKIEVLNKKQPGAKVIVMGDLNDNPGDRSVATTLGAGSSPAGVKPAALYNPFATIHGRGEGTEVYKKQWNLFDQIIISGTLLKGGYLRYKDAIIYKPSFLVDTYKGHEGEPYRSFKGTRWINGYSDHFPVVVYFAVSK